ncbi:DUF960 domain-containing protein [Lacticaseibacillus hulanensis]|uniref:DUF960 domain-containing protein n=1 Tax=Lacticaseibacillus hulanensis TaxID=2493111 RepID=UPI000FDB3C7B|nr:DUF960 domain-containing protein [Lacticaseibacillus hulanensis]
MFSANQNRFATFGVISRTPGPIIDAVWAIIDNNLQGVFPLQNLLKFSFKNNDGQLQVEFSESKLEGGLAVDLNYDYKPSLPDAVYAYDDGNAQTILLEDEIE